MGQRGYRKVDGKSGERMYGSQLGKTKLGQSLQNLGIGTHVMHHLDLSTAYLLVLRSPLPFANSDATTARHAKPVDAAKA